MTPISLLVTELLLGFASLSEVQRKLFLIQLNQFIIASPRQRRLKVERWEQASSPEESQVPPSRGR